MWRFYLFSPNKTKKPRPGGLGGAERCKITQLEPASRKGRPPFRRGAHSAADAARTLNKPLTSVALIVNHTAPLAVLGWFEIGSESHSQPVNTEKTVTFAFLPPRMDGVCQMCPISSPTDRFSTPFARSISKREDTRRDPPYLHPSDPELGQGSAHLGGRRLQVLPAGDDFDQQGVVMRGDHGPLEG